MLKRHRVLLEQAEKTPCRWMASPTQVMYVMHAGRVQAGPSNRRSPDTPPTHHADNSSVQPMKRNTDTEDSNLPSNRTLQRGAVAISSVALSLWLARRINSEPGPLQYLIVVCRNGLVDNDVERFILTEPGGGRGHDREIIEMGEMMCRRKWLVLPCPCRCRKVEQWCGRAKAGPR
ncbi:hypothetical protein LZ32DRAFT_115499 [Colletotrichum eremochloae]|nr:hypothetical protein LZ32DRAFT_115499 [Colletotrichum eremochloae]